MTILQPGLAVAAIWIVVKISMVAAGEPTEVSAFRSRFAELAVKRPQVVGLPALVQSFETLIREFDDGDEVAEVAMHVASLYELSDAKHQLVPDQTKALDWYTIAANSAVPSSPMWCAAQIRYADRLCSQGTTTSYNQARELLLAARPKCESSIHRLRVAQGLFVICLRQRNLKEAEEYCNEILKEGKAAKTAKTSRDDAAIIDAIKMGVVGSLIQRWGFEKIAPDENERRITRLRNELAEIPELDKSVTIAKHAIDEGRRSFEMTEQVRKSSGLRLGMILLNLTGVIIFLAVTTRRRKDARKVS